MAQSKETVRRAAWYRKPSPTFSDALALARQGAPDATQVADRWHLLSNWREAVERVFDRHRGRIKQVVLPVPEPVGKLAATVLPAKSVNPRV
jgi:hypothetical protein